MIGTYDYGWPRLKPQTIARKQTGDTPLLETGDLRASIEHQVNLEKKEAAVGSSNPKARWMELGTSRIPPRSFLLGAGMAKAEELHKIVGAEVHMHIISGGETKGSTSSSQMPPQEKEPTNPGSPGSAPPTP